jgi:uncharacterized protein
MNVFSIPIGSKYIIYAPLHQVLALVNGKAVQEIRNCLQSGVVGSSSISPIINKLQTKGQKVRGSSTGPLDPIFLGIIPTRGCNIACRYCDFAASKNDSPVMELAIARQAIEAYLLLQQSLGRSIAEIHFFGGEPFFADSLVHFAVEYASLRAAELGLDTFFEVTTNGVTSAPRCEWIADHFDTVVLSLDGPRDIQDRQRPAINGKSAFACVVRNARRLSQGPATLVLRACITNETVDRMEEIAEWFTQEFQPATVCFETLSCSPLSRDSGLKPPDPWQFARNFDRAREILKEVGIETVLSTAELNACLSSFCPVGKDALIISPDGSIAACYLLPESWQRRGLDLNLGRLEQAHFAIPPLALKRVRGLSVENRSLCAHCFCRFHCAGGCHVNHDTSGSPGQYDAQCIQTRLVSLMQLLDRLEQPALKQAWLADRSAMQVSAWQAVDRLEVTS